MHRMAERVDIGRIVRERKQKYEQKQFRALELVMKRLSD